ncbi:cobyric acid synthase [Limnoglobus roseus]|uniref:Cobyric acid synthase n=1 Tax=Limnoglobus roseus TaxID=2598579 RepID=A0A5C1AM42_9BACT|nr:cobyric acid synthase [Limnoglobus roseus]QEL18244.1 Cobyric acid synthase [Limnoglobus roseus]
MKPARTLMVQGTSSSVGKSLLTAGLCRLFARTGLRVAPFKAQNMSNNAAVCADGAEIGRAQALQALAAGVEPTADMNPVLLKPEADSRSQIVVNGKVWQTLPARSYIERKQFLWGHVTAALDRLRADHDLVVIEGAGSPVELNLKAGDIVNMAVAKYASAPVLLVGDIDRGGVFAQLLGTLSLFSAEERARVRGLIVNKFRGDPTLFEDGVRILEDRGGVPVLGVVPYLPRHGLPDEDAVAIETETPSGIGPIEIAVIRLPRIANFDDFDPLRNEPGVRLRFVDSPSHLGRPHAVILPGTKSTTADLFWLRDRGLAEPIVRLAAAGTAVVGICGGYQMLGRTIRDPQSVESSVREVVGLGLLDVETTFAAEKDTHPVRAEFLSAAGWMASVSGTTVTGYEIHMGRTPTPLPLFAITSRRAVDVRVEDGCATPDGRVWGCYLHGLFANDGLRRAWLASLHAGFEARAEAHESRLQAGLDRLADGIAAAIPFDRLRGLAIEGVRT